MNTFVVSIVIFIFYPLFAVLLGLKMSRSFHESGSFRPWVVSAGHVSAKFGVGVYSPGMWVVSAQFQKDRVYRHGFIRTEGQIGT